MSKKLTQKEFKDRIEKKYPGQFDLSKVIYKTNQTKVTVTCKKCGTTFDVRPMTLFVGKYGCRTCYEKNHMISSNKEEHQKDFVYKIKNKYGQNRFNYSKLDYTGPQSKIILICNKCGTEFSITAKELVRNGRELEPCPTCLHNRISLSTEEVIDRINKKFDNKYDTSEVKYVNARTPIILTCKDCGTKFSIIPNSIFYNKESLGGCPYCKQTWGEKTVTDYLKSRKLLFISQKRIYSTERYFIVDFYLEHNNRKYVIEYNGIQHYEPVKKFGGKLQYEKQKVRDRELQNLCNEKSIKLIWISYKLSKDKIFNMLDEIFL